MRIINNRFVQVIILVLFCMFMIAEFVFIYRVSNKANTDLRVHENIISMYSLNDKFDLLINRKESSFDQNIIDTQIDDFYTYLQYIQENSNVNLFFRNNEIKDDIKEIEKNFTDKKVLLRKFIILNTDFEKTFSEFKTSYINLLEPNQNAKLIGKIKEIHSYVIRLVSSWVFDKQEFKNKLSYELESYTNNDMANFIKYAEDIGKYIEYIKQLQSQNDKIQLKKNLDDFKKHFELYSKDITKNLYLHVILFFILIASFCIIAFLVFRWMKKNSEAFLRFKKIIYDSNNSILITDENFKIIDVNKAFENTTKYSKKDIIGQTPSILKSGFHDGEFYKTLNDKLLDGQTWFGEFINRDKDGQIIYEKTAIYPLFEKDKRIEGYLSISQDVTDEKNNLRELEARNVDVLFRYQIDQATGLWSINTLGDELEKKTNGYLIYIKISNYEDIRLLYGTLVANDIVKKVADQLKRFISIYNISGQPFRLNDDDFCIWYKHKRPSKDMLKAISSHLHSNTLDLDATLHNVEFHIGVSESKDLAQGDRLLQGIIAFYRAQKDGIPYAYYKENNELEREYRHNITTAQRIRNALSEGLVFVQCQPICFTQTKEVYSYEILMRLYDETGRVMYPGEFLEIAKQSALYAPLMHHVIVLTFDLLKQYPKVKFSMNMSIVDILDAETYTLFLSLLDTCNTPENLIVEILESEGIENYGDIKPYLKNIKEKGCKISIDDFGSGYSNYYRIMQLDVDHIKIDGSIIKELVHDKNAEIIVETIVGFAKKKGWKIVAEFVSNEKIYEKVKKYGIEYTQGYYLGKPIDL